MPARKSRPGKFGTASFPNPYTKITGPELILLEKFKIWERKAPWKDHYVGWPDMNVANSLRKKGYLKESPQVTGCFFVTDLFKNL